MDVSSSRLIATARRSPSRGGSGVDARVATWPDFDDGRFDAVVFTRSLHHIHPLDESIGHAADNLTDEGRIIVEDFAYESADAKTLRWFASTIRLLSATGLLVQDCESLNKILSKTETLKAWRRDHERQLHTAAEIGGQLEKLLGNVVKEEAPYYFRYLVGAIVATEKSDAILQAVAEQEAALAADGAIVALGRRIMAERPRANKS
jgi:SAM-dependent methyltransferase